MKKKTMVKSYGMSKGRKGMKKGKKKVAGAKSAKLTAKQKTLPDFIQKEIAKKKKKSATPRPKKR